MSETSVRCIAITQAGTRCKLHARPGAETCHIHAKQAARSADKKPRPATAPGGAIVKVANETAPAKRRERGAIGTAGGRAKRVGR